MRRASARKYLACVFVVGVACHAAHPYELRHKSQPTHILPTTPTPSQPDRAATTVRSTHTREPRPHPHRLPFLIIVGRYRDSQPTPDHACEQAASAQDHHEVRRHSTHTSQSCKSCMQCQMPCDNNIPQKPTTPCASAHRGCDASRLQVRPLV